tara:strand:+ start:64 stop:372 length:309 start_codon:yes stop_codon:yes gene_type:complete
MQLTLFHIPDPPPRYKRCSCGNRIWNEKNDVCRWCAADEKKTKTSFEDRLKALRKENLERTAVYGKKEYYLEDRINKKPVEFFEDETDKEMRSILRLKNKIK